MSEIYHLITERTFARLAMLCEQQELQLPEKQRIMLGEASLERVRKTEENLNLQIRREIREGKVVRYYKLMTRCTMEPAAICAMELALTAQRYPESLGIIKALGFSEVTLEFAILLEAAGRGESPEDGFLKAERLFAQVEKILCHQSAPMPFYRYPLWADERLMGYLWGSDTLDKRLHGVAEQYFYEEQPEELLTGHAHAEKISVALQPRFDGTQNLIQLAGSVGSGRKTLFRAAAHQAQLDVLFVDYSILMESGEKLRREQLWSIRREMLFYEMGVCFYGLEENEGCKTRQERKEFLRECVEPLLGTDAVVCINTLPKTELVSLLKPYLCRIELPALTRDHRIEVWEGCAKKNGLKMDCISAAIKFKLTTEEICKAAERLAAGGQIEPDSAAVAKVCAEVLEPAAKGNVKLVRSGYTLDDLKLPKEQKKQLYHICAHVWQRHKVYDEWNMESRYAYGRNVSALFVGPPGTGKTMAVHVLADMLELPLYRIDISQIVDKYIGETEKRLEEVFDTAEKNNAILFFDEADSIFGKRSEVNDAKDKYANTEVSYILQRMEEYDGIVILATNYKKNIDEAFMRRIRYLVEFTLPGEEIRREIWESGFAPEVPLEDVNFEYLARQFELSGGNIKNIILNATFRAAAEGKPVGMLHILESIRTESLKMGKTMIYQDFAEYGVLLENKEE